MIFEGFENLHFAYPIYLWALLAIPLVSLFCFFFCRRKHQPHQLEKFIDSHLLPYLLRNPSSKKGSLFKYLFLWSLVWSLLTLAIAGPRWSFREMETFSKDQSLVVLLDLSKSMDASDVKPSRLILARQKIEDLINASKGVKIGLIAFAADPHMIIPLTEDKEAIRHLLPTLDTDLVYKQGSKLAPALDMASDMLDAEPGSNKAVVVVSDGGFEDASALVTAKKLAGRGIVIHTVGVGTIEGSPLKYQAGNVVKRNGVPILSKLDIERLVAITKIGNGTSFGASHLDQSVPVILKELDSRAEAQVALGKKDRFWDEYFYLLIIPALPILLWWFKRGAIVAMVSIMLFPSFNLQADVADHFKNSEELGKQALDCGDYETATHQFQDPYRKGVAYYKAGRFAEAAELFKQSDRPEVTSSAAYNLGNAFAQQHKYKEAITAYENVLKQWPDHAKAKENLEIVKKLQEEEQQQGDGDSEDEQQNDDSQEDQKNQDNENQDKQEKEDNNQDDSDDSDNKNEEDNQDSQEQQNEDSSEDDEKNNDQDKEKQEQEPEKDDQEEGSDQDKQQEEEQPPPQPKNEEQSASTDKSQEDYDADLWLNRISNDPKAFMKNKFYIESVKKETTEGVNPW